jgi:hypothetical protein
MLLTLIQNPIASVATRVLMIGSVLPWAAHVSRRPHRLESQWMRRLAIYWWATALAGALVVVLRRVGYDQIEEITKDLGRQAYIVTFTMLLTIGLQYPKARRALSLASIPVALAISGVIVLAFLDFGGGTLAGISNATAFKDFAAEKWELAVNPLSFAAIAAFFLSIPVLWGHRFLRAVVSSAVFCASVLSGARTTQVSVLVGAVIAFGVLAMRRLPQRTRVALYVVLMIAGSAASLVLTQVGMQVDGYAANELTTNRYELWIAGVEKASESPLIGWGAGSWRDDLERYMPGFATYGAAVVVENVRSGGFHNAYLTLVAEKGLVTLVPGLILLWFVFTRSVVVSGVRSTLGASDRRAAAIAPFFIVIQFVRGFGEQPGLFGKADGLVDFLVFAAAAQVIAVAVAAEREMAKQVSADAQLRPAGTYVRG